VRSSLSLQSGPFETPKNRGKQPALLPHSLQGIGSFPSGIPVFDYLSAAIEKSQLSEGCIAWAVGDVDTELVELLNRINLKANFLSLTTADNWKCDGFTSRQNGFFVSGEEDLALPLQISFELEGKTIRASGGNRCSAKIHSDPGVVTGKGQLKCIFRIFKSSVFAGTD
jgi:hypothetical protein